MIVRTGWSFFLFILFLIGCGNTTTTEPQTVVDEEVVGEFTQYAEGFESDSFGEAFRSPSEGIDPLVEIPAPEGIWEDLLTLAFDISYDQAVDDVVFKPLYSKRIKKHEGKIIEIKGFMIPYEVTKEAMGETDSKKEMFMFSAYPIAACFFCGGAGAESVLEAFPKQKIKATTEKIKLRGRLKFTNDYLRMPYILENVTLVSE
jgi:hypothetical protein